MNIAVIVVGTFAICLLYCNNASKVKFTNFVCQSYNKSLTIVNECRLKAISRNKTVLNFNATVFHPIHNILVAGRFFKRENGYKPWLYKFEVDACLFHKRPFNPLAIMVYKLFRNYSNLNHTCPYVGPQIVKGFHIQYEMFGLPVPSGDFLLELNWTLNKKLTVNTDIYVNIDEKI